MEKKYQLTVSELAELIHIGIRMDNLEKNLYSKEKDTIQSAANYLTRIVLKEYEEKIPEEVRKKYLHFNAEKLKEKSLEVLSRED